MPLSYATKQLLNYSVQYITHTLWVVQFIKMTDLDHKKARERRTELWPKPDRVFKIRASLIAAMDGKSVAGRVQR